MDSAAIATITVALVTALVAPYILARFTAKREDRKQKAEHVVEERGAERAILQKQLETLLAEQNNLRESLRLEIRERDEAIRARDERIRTLDDRISIVEETLLDYQAGRISPAGYVLVPVAYVLQWRRGEIPGIPPERFVGEPGTESDTATSNFPRRDARRELRDGDGRG